MKDRIAKSVCWLVWSRGGLQLLSFTSTILVARLLHPSDYGLMALVGIWTIPITLIAEMGLGAAIVQFRDMGDRELNACFWLAMGLSGIGYLALYVAAPTVALWFAAPKLSHILRVAGLTLPLTAVRIVPDSLLRKHLALDKISQAEIASAVGTIPVMLGLALAGAGVWALVAGALTGPMIQSVATFWLMPWRPGLRVGGGRFREVVRYSLATLGIKACVACYQQTDAFVLGKVSGEVAVGFYSMAKQLALLPAEKVSTVVNLLASPVMAELQANQKAMRSVLLRGIRLVASATLPLCLGLMLVAEDLVLVALTDKWISAVPALQVLCLYAVIRSLDVLFPPLLLACYRTNFLFGYTVVLLGIMPLAFWAGAEWQGTLGVAVAWVVAYPMLVIWMVRKALQEVDVSWKLLWRQLRPLIGATLVMLGTVWMVRLVVSSWEGEAGGSRLAIMTVFGATAYSLTLFGTGSPVLLELRELLGWVLRGNRVAASGNLGRADQNASR